MNEAAEITVIVLSARGLQGKKPGRCKFSVIFGVGSKKYRTAVIKDTEGNPEWNEESTIQVVNSLDQAFFIVTEKDDVLGQINIPITTLQGPPGRTVQASLQPHKKCLNPNGDLIYQCYVSRYRSVHEPVIKSAAPNKFQSQANAFKKRFSLAGSPVINLKNRKEGKSTGGSKLGTINKKFSKSIQDIFSFGKSHENENDKNMRGSTAFGHMSIGTGMDSAGKLPVITSVTPSQGLIEGGTKVTIEGKHLGLSKADIIDLTFCECDCVESVIWESSNRIYCTTKPSLPGLGDVVIETESGGIGCLRHAYVYCEDLPPEENNPFDNEEDEDEVAGSPRADFTIGDELDAVSTPPSSPKRVVILPRAESSENITSQGNNKKNNYMKHKRRASEGVALTQMKSKCPPSPEVQPSLQHLMCQLEKLKLENIALRQENKDMKSYIDRLLPKVIVHCPEALEAEKYLNKTG